MSRHGNRSVSGVDLSEASKSGCSSGKWRFPTRKAARTLERALHEKGVRVYRCGECGSFHVGHLPGRVRAGDTAERDFYKR